MKHFFVLALFLLPFTNAEEVRPNVLLITVDDMSADSLGCFGSKLKNTSPRTDQFARESLRFQHAHVCVANCYPSRNVMFSGLYPHNNGVEGFYPIKNKYPILCDILKSKGYYTGIRGKVT
ncbi:sulfatase-like hydrolase/transferase, partial [Akkermansiaceae bacterium]|nr:sulfatase-like hydrolase/transferase [Akkermansiaceae bacterium]